MNPCTFPGTRRGPRALRGPAILAALVVWGAADANAAEWTWSLTPYVWATSVGVDAEIEDRRVLDTTISVSDLAEDLDATLQVHAEGQRGANGLLFDMFYVHLADDGSTVAAPTALGATATLDSDIAMTIFEAGGIYDPRGDQKGFTLLYGTRVFDQSAEIDALLVPDPDTSVVTSYQTRDTLVDGFLGARYVQRFSRHWSGALRADVGAGGTQFTWNVTSTLAYSFGKRDRYAVTGGYRRMQISFKDEDSVHVDMTLSGFYAGFRFSF